MSIISQNFVKLVSVILTNTNLNLSEIMKKRFFLIGSIALSSILVSCATSSHQTRTQKVLRTPILTSPMVADVKVDLTKKIEGHAEDKSLEAAKSKARNEAVIKSGADIIVDPVYSYRKALVGKYKVTVQGFYGKYESVRNLNLPDTSIYKLMGTPDVFKSEEKKGGLLPQLLKKKK